MEPATNSGKIFSENAVAYALYRCCASRGSKVFLQLKNNLALASERSWSFWFAPDVDVLEIRPDNTIVAYELKGARRYKNEIGWPGYYDGLNQALAYLNLPFVLENDQPKFSGGAFDYVYLVHARPELKFSDYERRVLSLVPMIGFGVVLPDGTFTEIMKPIENPISDKDAKAHFLANLDTLRKFSPTGKTFRKIETIGKAYFAA